MNGLKLTRNHLLSAAGTVLTLLLSWVGAVALDVKEKADRVPGLEKQAEKTYDEVQVLRQQATEQLIVLYTAIGNLTRVSELKQELEKLKAEAAKVKASKDSKEETAK